MFQSLSAVQYLKVDIANNFGLDRENWDVRLAWFDAHEHELEALTKDAEETALYSAGVRAWRNHQKGNVNHYPISLDATSSGIQILAALIGDRKAAELCNIIDIGERADAYTIMYHRLLEKLGDSAKISRKDTKRSIMTSFYGSTAVPKEVFGEGPLLDLFNETMEENAPGAWELNQTMLDIWNPKALTYDWTLPDNFNVHIKVLGQETEYVHFLNKPYEVTYTVNKPVSEGRSLCANMTHSIDGYIVREMVRRCNYDTQQVQAIRNWMTDVFADEAEPDEGKDQLVLTLNDLALKTGMMSARILDYITPNNLLLVNQEMLKDLLDSLPAKPFEVIAVHD